MLAGVVYDVMVGCTDEVLELVMTGICKRLYYVATS